LLVFPASLKLAFFSIITVYTGLNNFFHSNLKLTNHLGLTGKV